MRCVPVPAGFCRPQNSTGPTGDKKDPGFLVSIPAATPGARPGRASGVLGAGTRGRVPCAALAEPPAGASAGKPCVCWSRWLSVPRSHQQKLRAVRERSKCFSRFRILGCFFFFFFNSLTCRGCRWLRIFADPGVLLPPTRWHRARESNFHCQEAAYQLYETISLVWEGSYSAFGSQEKKKRSPNRLSKIL